MLSSAAVGFCTCLPYKWSLVIAAVLFGACVLMFFLLGKLKSGFSVIICLLKQSGILSTLAVWTSLFFGIPSEIVAAVLTGSIEMTSGIFMLPSFLGKEVTFPIASFLLGWGGFSVHFQTKSVLVDNNLNFREYYTGKLIHGIFSLIFAIIFSNILF